MTLEEILQNYALNDGKVLSFQIQFADDSMEETYNIVTVALNVRRHVTRQQFESCTVIFEFSCKAEVEISEDFRTMGGYTDIVIAKLANGQFYLSVDPCGNTGHPNDNDNFVIKGEKLLFVEDGKSTYVS